MSWRSVLADSCERRARAAQEHPSTRSGQMWVITRSACKKLQTPRVVIMVKRFADKAVMCTEGENCFDNFRPDPWVTIARLPASQHECTCLFSRQYGRGARNVTDRPVEAEYIEIHTSSFHLRSLHVSTNCQICTSE